MEQSPPRTHFSLPSPSAQPSRAAPVSGSSRRTGVASERVGDGRPNLLVDTISNNARLCAPEHVTRQLHAIATSTSLAVIIDVDALTGSPFARGDRLTRLALDALSHVGVQVVVVASIAMDRAVALQRGLPEPGCLATTRAAVQTRDRNPSLRIIAISNDSELLASLGPEDRGFTVACSTNPSHGVLPGEVSMRAVLWWLVSLRGTAR